MASPRRSQADRTDRIIGYSAMFTSLLALVVSIVQLKQNDMAQRASAWPYLGLDIATSPDKYVLELTNSGTGPAIIKSYQYVSNGVRLANMRTVVKDMPCAGTSSERTISTNGVLPGNTAWVMFDLKSDSACIDQISNAGIVFRVTYCSVYDDCWELTDTLGGLNPRLIKVPNPG